MVMQIPIILAHECDIKIIYTRWTLANPVLGDLDIYSPQFLLACRVEC